MATHLLSLHPGTISLILSYLMKCGDDDNDSVFSGDSDSQPEDEFGIDRGSLARVARTCRQLWSPAVAILWRELPTFTPILLTLPADLYTLELVHTEESEPPLLDASRDLYRLIPTRFATTVEVEPTRTETLADRIELVRQALATLTTV